MKQLHYTGFYVNVPEKASEHYSFTGNPPAKIKSMCANLEKQGVILPSAMVINSIRKELNIVPDEIKTVD